MLIASVTFYDPIREIGGGTTPSFAFADWARLLGHEVATCYNPRVESLNCFDAIFFNTPPRNDTFPFEDLIVPYALMMHVHNDLDKYPLFTQMVESDYCRTLVHIEHGEQKFFAKYHDNPLSWYPCCMPENFYRQPYPSSAKRMLYASRIADWKNTHLCKQSEIPCDIFGSCFDPEYALEHGITPVPFNLFDHEDVFLYENYDIFWNLFGNEDTPMTVKRMDLSGWEAVAKGLMPIVNRDAMPEEFKGVFIEADPIRPNFDKLKYDIESYRTNKERAWHELLMTLQGSSASYSSVGKQVLKIIESIS